MRDRIKGIGATRPRSGSDQRGNLPPKTGISLAPREENSRGAAQRSATKVASLLKAFIYGVFAQNFFKVFIAIASIRGLLSRRSDSRPTSQGLREHTCIFLP